MSSAFVSQCKVQLRLAVSRLRLQRNKKQNGVKNAKYEVAELLRKGNDESARIKAESIIREDFVIEAYDILELLCETILARLPLMQLTKDCPAEVKEAVSTVIYAAPRTEVKELVAARALFIKQYGKPFAQAAMDNCLGTVNARVIHKLSVLTPEPFLVFQYLTEIARAHNVDWCADDHCDAQAHGAAMPKFSPICADPACSPQIPQMPVFPSVPGHNPHSPPPPHHGGGGSGGFPEFPQFPSVPPSNQHPQFPSVPSSQPQFPSVPTSQPQFPSFPAAPSSNSPQMRFPDFPAVPSSGSPSMPQFPSVPTQSNFPDFPQPPSNNFPQFPSVPPSHPPSQPQFPSFPSPPTSQRPNSNDLPQFPSVPPSQQFPSFPTPPSSSSPQIPKNNSQSQFPSFPSPPPSSNVRDELDDLPQFTNASNSQFPSVPQYNSNEDELDFIHLPSVPKHNDAPSDFPSFPSVPRSNSNSNGFPQFPAAPSSPNPPPASHPSNLGSNGFPQFPAAPSNTSNGFPQFPAAPTSHSPSLSFPSVPTNAAHDDSANIPDFDDLTARFEALKKRNN